MEWRDIPNYSRYLVSENGDIIRKQKYHHMSSNKMKSKPDKRGYLRLILTRDDDYRKAERVHRIVAMAFLDNKEEKPQVNHIDGDKINNHFSNLEWCTNLENMQHAVNNGLATKSKGESQHLSKLTKEDVLNIRSEYVPRKVSLESLGEKYGVNLGSIHNVVTRKTWKHI